MAESFLVDVLRPLDMLHLRFEFRGLRLEDDGAGGLRLVPDSDDPDDRLIVVHFPSQHIAEAVVQGDPPGTAVEARMAAPSRLAFRPPRPFTALPFALDPLLDWNSWDPVVVPAALPRGSTFAQDEPKPEVRAPRPDETAIELPYRLVLSPSFLGGWWHSNTPVSHDARTELWHTRLVVRRPRLDGVTVDPLTAKDRDVRAVWTPDLDTEAPPDGITTSLDAKQRGEIVCLSSSFDEVDANGRPFRPEPIAVDRLMLSAAGGWLRSRGIWDPAEGLGLSEWAHVATQGRDHFVRVVEEGVLFPFGHRAAKITITERKVKPAIGGVAVLEQSTFIVVREPVKTYEGQPYPFGGREMPFESIRVLTLFTAADEETTVRGSFWPVMPPVREQDEDNVPVPFHMVGRDRTGRDVDFHAAVIFVPKGIMDDDPVGRRRALSGVLLEYQFQADAKGRKRERIAVAGAPLAFAPPGPDPARVRDTTLTTEELTFDVHLDGSEPGAFPFLPFLRVAMVRIPASEQLLGRSKARQVQLADPYLRHGLDHPTQNAAQLFASLTAPLDVALPPERAGALANPDMAIQGLSRNLGPLGGDLDQLATGQFPTNLFPSSARLLGAVSLEDLVVGAFEPPQFPKMLTRTNPNAEVTVLDWDPRVKETGPLKSRGAGMGLTVRTEIERPLDGKPPTTRTAATLRNFTFNFAEVLEVRFDSLTFTSEPGRKPDVSAELDAESGVVFLGPLSFLNALRRFIPAGGFSDPPAVDVSPTGIQVGYSLLLPPLAVGVFALENVRLGASLHLPFGDGAARVRFNFAERHEQFVLTVSGLGGGGFLGLALGLDGIETIEAALEFGASVSMNFGVASGGVHIMAGIYFRYELATEATVLTGYVRMGGELEVLGLISVSVELFLGLTYQTGPERIEGEATLVIKVEVLFFSESVELTVRRSFAKAAGDPPFGEVMSKGQWSEYASAFAA